MNKKTAVLAYSTAFVVGVAATKHLMNRIEHRRMKVQHQKSIAHAMGLLDEAEIVIEAAHRLQQRALTGYYDGRSMADVEYDYDFEIIRLHEEK